jgi:hypothetical protein
VNESVLQPAGRADHLSIEVQAGASTVGPGLLSGSSAVGPVNRIGFFVMPWVAALGFHGLPVGERVLAVSRTSRSTSAIIDVAWLLDNWTYSEDAVSVEQVRMLNELLALEVAEGLTLEFPD